ncbi:hypothetical protein [Sphingopyxis sp. JAI128]|uniref:hypothetical protein n=1 Tax=Sphingopyxis sp. JAI128 TaxID=2723066 RepID=UPI0016182409|nr:hypothetical protein [Sphingopyxis sp. JAI128]MBB6426445.1 hypothetical protein [Sphingopyxis sp. JAI128]
MSRINDQLLTRLPLLDIDRVTFYKRDEVTTDLICCDIIARDAIWSFHEEVAGWDLLLRHLQKLPQFCADWYEAASPPPFALSEIVAFSR